MTITKKAAPVKAVKSDSGFVKVGSAYAPQTVFDVLSACIATKQPALLIGETGTGKTSVIRELAIQSDRELIRVSVNGTTGIEEILGKWLAKDGDTVWVDGILPTAMKKGHWIVFDELNAALPEILFALHPLLDDDRKVMLAEKDNEVVRPHEDFMFFGSMNPPEDYAGTKDMNRALLSRFQAVIKIDPIPNEIEFNVIVEQGKVESVHATQLVQIAQSLRNEKTKGNIFYFCSTRDLIQAARLIVGGVSLGEAVRHAIVNKMSNDELELVKKSIETVVNLAPKSVRNISDLVSDNQTLASQNVALAAENNKVKAEKSIYDAKMKALTNENVTLKTANTGLHRKVEIISGELTKRLIAAFEKEEVIA